MEAFYTFEWGSCSFHLTLSGESEMELRASLLIDSPFQCSRCPSHYLCPSHLTFSRYLTKIRMPLAACKFENVTGGSTRCGRIAHLHLPLVGLCPSLSLSLSGSTPTALALGQIKRTRTRWSVSTRCTEDLALQTGGLPWDCGLFSTAFFSFSFSFRFESPAVSCADLVLSSHPSRPRHRRT